MPRILARSMVSMIPSSTTRSSSSASR